jgi:hypothetical protein
MYGSSTVERKDDRDLLEEKERKELKKMARNF